MSSGVVAATSGTKDLSVSVGAVNTLVLTDAGATMSDINSAGLSRVAVCYLKLNNNSSTGFKITLSSAKSGKLVRFVSGAYSDTSKTGNWVNYYVSLVGVSGILGTSEPSLPLDESLSANQEVLFSNSVERATVDKVYSVNVSTTAKSDLFQGTFRDTITATIADI
ncbi:hypothetical protein EBR57_07040 [bacterium]|nr:hypothetical protein [bacterium]